MIDCVFVKKNDNNRKKNTNTIDATHRSVVHLFGSIEKLPLPSKHCMRTVVARAPREMYDMRSMPSQDFIQSRNAENYSFIIVSICQHKLLFEWDRWMKMARKFRVNRNENGRQPSTAPSFACHLIYTHMHMHWHRHTREKANIATPFPIECCLAKHIRKVINSVSYVDCISMWCETESGLWGLSGSVRELSMHCKKRLKEMNG